MAKLILSIDDVVIREHALTKERTTLRRKSANDIQIDNLAVSGEHAVIFTLLNDSFIEDLSSTNGTVVNGKPVLRHLLQNGDVIALGKHRLQFVSEVASPAADIVRDYERTMVVRGQRKENAKPDLAVHSASTPETDVDDGELVERQSAIAVGASAGKMPPRAEVQILNGAGAGRTLELSKSITTIGKTGGDIAVVARRSNGYFLAAV